MKQFFTFLIAVLVMLSYDSNAQVLRGTVVGGNESVIGANVAVKGTSVGTISDIDGSYELKLKPGTYDIEVSYTGFEPQVFSVTVAEGESKVMDVALLEGVSLNDVVVTGTRTAPRSATSTPLPIDVVGAADLISTGQNTFDKALTYKIPSFNSVNTPVNDATSLLDPYEIRNMGPSRTLILINGKRKNTSALLYTQTSPGRGETGADISAIPQQAIERVEILRDGASAQYGSDAIAGVMNIILKEDANNGSVTLNAGMTGEGDGETYGVAVNNGAKIGETGFINYTIDLSKREVANRPGTVDADGEFGDFVFVDPNDADGNPKPNAEEIIAANADGRVAVDNFLRDNPDAGNINGSPETTAAKFSANMGIDITENTEVYANAAYVYKKVNSFANYRTPYWRTEEAFPYLADFFPNGPNGEYVGYVPTFDGNLNDYNGTIGVRNQKNGWISDVSFTIGGNEQTYLVSNSHNRNEVLVPTWNDANGDGIQQPEEVTFSQKYRENSPILFDVGGTRFQHAVGNLDITKRLSDQVGIAFGSEFRSETFTVIEGSESAYEAGGPDSFAGTDPRNAGKFNRYNFGGYLDFAFDITDDFLINATGRVENYSDFGTAAVWKISSRYKLADDKVTVRGSASTGFRAPLLHQIYTQKAQYSFIPGQGIQVGGLINNVSREARLLGLPSLDAEKSTNITLGIGIKPDYNWSFTLDYYNIAVQDRIILSTEISKVVPEDGVPLTEGEATLNNLLDENNLSDLSFFANALDTRTSGIDFVASYRNLDVGAGKMNFNLSGNYVIQNERDGEVKNPQIVEDAGQTVSNQTQEALFFTSRPEMKVIFGIEYKVGKLVVSLNNTYFGKTTFYQQGLNDGPENAEGIRQYANPADPEADTNGLFTEFIPKIVTDLGVSYMITDKATLALNVNNLLNVLPEWEFKADYAPERLQDEAYLMNQSNLITFNQRYSQMTYDGYHFSQLGTLLNLSLNIQF